MSEPVADIALVGLAVMGQNLILNMNDHGFTVCAYNRTVSKVDDFLADEAAGTRVVGARSVQEMVAKCKRPRRIMMLVKAGDAVDGMIDQVSPFLEEGDILIDSGNSNYRDTIRRTAELARRGLRFIGTGVSGGEEGARNGPSIMPGGDPAAWPHVKDIFQSISAQADGEPCCDWVGGDGAGHYVKMVHNGIEYGDMQLICEAYHLMKEYVGLDHAQMHEVFASWNEGVLDSYLIEITRDIMAYADPDDGEPLVEKILDAAGQKGTGKWTVISALETGMPVTLIGEAVFARCLSALKDERVKAAKSLKGPKTRFRGDAERFVNYIQDALYASKIVSYAQGFMLLREAATEHRWDLDYASIAKMWRGGCIIRSAFLGRISEAYRKKPKLRNLLLDTFFKNEVRKAQRGWREVVAKAVKQGIPVPAFSSALAFYDGYRHERLPANLLQAQRDYFGAHTYERVDRERGEFFHTNWTGRGGDTSASTYSV